MEKPELNIAKVALAFGIEHPKFITDLKAHLDDIYRAGVDIVLSDKVLFPLYDCNRTQRCLEAGPMAGKFRWGRDDVICSYSDDYRDWLKVLYRDKIVVEGFKVFLQTYLKMMHDMYSDRTGMHTEENFRALGFTEMEAKTLTNKPVKGYLDPAFKWAYRQIVGRIRKSPVIVAFTDETRFADEPDFG